MKKVILSCFIFVLSAFGWANNSVNSTMQRTRIPFSVHGVNPGGAGNTIPKAPRLIPEISQDGHTLYIEAVHPGYALFLRNLDGMVVFYAFVPNSQNTIELPGDLSGEYEIELQCASYSLIGEIEL